MGFNSDLKQLIDVVHSNASESEIKKAYLSLVKKYHPDGADEKLKTTYNQYMVLINTVYAGGKTKAKEIRIGDDKINPKHQADYFRQLFSIAKKELSLGMALLQENYLNLLDRKAIEENSLEVMRHYLNAIKCFKYIVQNSPDRVLVDSSEFDMNMLMDYNCKLAKTLLNNNEKQLTVVL